jgi:hypothetical protein
MDWTAFEDFIVRVLRRSRIADEAASPEVAVTKETKV